MSSNSTTKAPEGATLHTLKPASLGRHCPVLVYSQGGYYESLAAMPELARDAVRVANPPAPWPENVAAVLHEGGQA